MFVIAQTKQMDCWATASAILASWKELQLVPTDKFVSRLDEKFRILYDTDAGLPAADQPDLMTPTGMRQEAPQNYTVNGWLSLLKSFGPLMVVTAFAKEMENIAKADGVGDIRPMVIHF